MPIYEYKCENGHLFDVMQKMSEDSLTQCVECGAPVRKVLHPVNISFKGSGFYSTDYSNGSRAEKSETTSGANSDNGEAGSSSKDSSSEGSSEKAGGGKESSSSSEKAARKQD